MEVIESIQAAISVVSKLRELSKKLENAEIKMLIADLSNDLADAKLHAANVKSEMADLKAELTDIKQQALLRSSAKPRFDDGGYHFEGEDGHFCTGCYDSKGQKIRLSRMARDFEVFGKWECPVCKKGFG
jgi:hypothetical protein